jgi:hypothetical protein
MSLLDEQILQARGMASADKDALSWCQGDVVTSILPGENAVWMGTNQILIFVYEDSLDTFTKRCYHQSMGKNRMVR